MKRERKVSKRACMKGFLHSALIRDNLRRRNRRVPGAPLPTSEKVGAQIVHAPAMTIGKVVGLAVGIEENRTAVGDALTFATLGSVGAETPPPYASHWFDRRFTVIR